MFRSLMIAVAAIGLSSCASTAMKGFVGKPIDEAFMSYGRPENVFDLADGRRAFQFRWGGASGVLPGRSETKITPNGYGYTVTSTGVPATVIDSPGCLVTLIGKPSGNSYVVEEYRIPKRLVC